MLRLITQHASLIDWNEPKQKPLPDNAVFLDLLNPSRQEELEAEQWLEHLLPTREEMQEIEESSRLYTESGALYMTAWVPVGLDTPDPENSSITFVVSHETITTVRYADPMAFRILPELVKKQCTTPITSDAVFLLIIERIVARIADTLQNIEMDLKHVSRDIFNMNSNTALGGEPERDLNEVIKLLGRRNQLVANLRESLVTIARVLQFFLNHAAPWMRADLAPQFRSVARDVKSLDDYTNQQTQEMTFLLDSTLGLINIQQNQIIKIMTVASVVLMPPTLIAGIYGMNFKHMPELEHEWAYPLAWLFMIVAGITPIFYFKWKKML
jgi:magnesium transporter